MWRQSAFVRAPPILLHRVAHWPQCKTTQQTGTAQAADRAVAKAHCVRKAAAAIRPTIHRQAASPIQLLEATAACRRSPRSGSLPVPFPQELRDSARESAQRIDVPHHSEEPRKKLSPASHTDLKKDRQSERSPWKLSPAGRTDLKKHIAIGRRGRSRLRDASTNL